MRPRTVPLLTGLALFAAACGGGGGAPDVTPPPKTPEETAERYLTLWDEEKFDEMYDLVSSAAQETTERKKFVERYEAIGEEATITKIDFRLRPRSPSEAIEVPYTVTIETSFFGDIKQDNVMPLVREDVPQPTATEETPKTREEWRVEWTPALVFKEIEAGALVHFFTRIPRRGTIYDRGGEKLAIDASLAVVGIVPELITDKEKVIARLSSALGLLDGEVRAHVETTLPEYYFIPVKSLPYGTSNAQVQKFRDMVELGVVVHEETKRLYPHGDVAAHVLGYMTEVTEEQLKALGPKGFEPGDLIGAFGLELSMNDVLGGERGGLLATITPEGAIARKIAEKQSVAGKDIHLALHIAVQKKAEKELGQRVGSIVVMDPRDNGVLALATYPRFDPNAFIRGLTTAEFNALSGDKRQPFLNRPLLATYPPGSTFKVVTMAAGIEKGGFGTGSTIHCAPVWTGLGEEFAKNNWQKVDRGWLTPSEGLMASCNPVFYEMAKALDEKDENALPAVAADFGYGAPTGIKGLDEAAGTVAGPAWKQENIGEPWYRGDAVNMGIGQGFMSVTPLQIANAYAAIAGPGILRQPLLITKVSELGGALSQDYKAEEINRLPVSPSTLDAIRYGLGLVINSAGGTSYQAWTGSSVDAAGKSGTAEDIVFGQHVFFVAYANRGAPSVLALAALETGESGSREAAPMVRRILESYLGGLLARAGP